MLRRAMLTAVLLVIGVSGAMQSETSQAANPGQPSDWERFYYYPYVYYPHNFQRYPESYDHLYYRYPAERRIPVYNANWHNFYPSERPYHKGHHFILDVF